ncbi:hypothetical protein NP493_851g01039 [Ridgeia piscesae]|uniref:Nipped-B protein n=1 Tax=Ridgeia piscesae TaxID=27915 RepID=A0AAD9KLZ7_RIDPI|nr:hypothetical protein NP493_851g01039 [Ridgeia piscesae]
MCMLQSLLNMFDETGKATLSELIYMADNMAFLPYQVQDEPLYIIHQIDIIVSVSGSNILQSYKETQMMTMTFPHPPQSGHGPPAPRHALWWPGRGRCMDAAQGGPETANHKTQNQLPFFISPGMAMEIMVVERVVIAPKTDKLCDDYVQVEIRKAPSSLMAYHKRSMSSHHRHGRTSKSSSLSSKPHKHKKKKRRGIIVRTMTRKRQEDSDYVV